MLKSTLVITLLLLFQSATAQELADFNKSRLKRQKRAMRTLAGWSAVSVVGGTIGALTTQGEAKSFHQMNAGWGAVNLMIVGGGFLQIKKAMAKEPNLAESVKDYYKVRSILLFNAGLDLAYISSGFYLLEKAKNSADFSDKNRFNGFGKSVILQGGFLLAFDLITYLRLGKEEGRLEPLLSQQGVGFRLKF